MFDLPTLVTIAGILGLNVLVLYNAFVRRWRRYTEKETKIRAEQIKEDSIRIMQEGLITELMTSYYSSESLQRADLVPYSFKVNGIKVDTTIATKDSWVNLHVPLDGDQENCELDEKDVPPVQKFDEEETAEIFVAIEERGLKIWNAPIYRLLELDLTQNNLKARFALDQYYNYRFTIGALNDEVLEALIKSNFSIESIINNKEKLMPKRRMILPDGGALANLENRMCAGGVLVLFAMAREEYNDFAIIIQRRSREVSERQTVLSVLPQAYHQPMINPKAEVNLSSTVYRELYEELFGGDEAEKEVRRLIPDWFFKDCEPLEWFHKHQHRGVYKLECTCFGLNLVQGNYEFGILLTVYDESYWRKFSHLLETNWEVLDNYERVDISSAIDISSMDSNQLANVMQRKEWDTAGLFSFTEGLKRLSVLEPSKVTLPTIEQVTP